MPTEAEKAVAGNVHGDENAHDEDFFHPAVRGLSLQDAKIPEKRTANLLAAPATLHVNLSNSRPPKVEHEDLIGWQPNFVKLLQDPAEHRARHLCWLHNKNGMIGKTECGKHVEQGMFGLRSLNPTSQPEAMFLLAEFIRRHNRPPHAIVLDFSKSTSVSEQQGQDAEHAATSSIPHDSLETLIDASVCSYKCTGMVGQTSRAHVVAFANVKPDRTKMNATRFANHGQSTVLDLDVHADEFRAACAKVEGSCANDVLIVKHAAFFGGVETALDNAVVAGDVTEPEHAHDDSADAGASSSMFATPAPSSDSGDAVDASDEGMDRADILNLFAYDSGFNQ